MIGVKWILKTKLKLDGSVQNYKAKLVVKDYAQQFGVDYNETFSPVLRQDIIRAILALAAQKGWKVFQLDVKSAFLNVVLEEEIYIEQPPGFIVKGHEDQPTTPAQFRIVVNLLITTLSEMHSFLLAEIEWAPGFSSSTMSYTA